ncbi:DUF58 domain-containing protein [Pinibacter soli]|uniref:DUF58 domain-containing protein n=1 Tax=Pinibacter soli TaxID=3044211 RepID=A0ABT6R9Z0_9BACT|nr:DUF58 domain-containing protein [Pinibacter soli]MDI3319391.1 DUF58 domain-containing protein [Pinibacter soli]
MFGFKKNKQQAYPPEVATNLQDLMRYEYLVQAKNLLPSHPIYSILAGRHASKLRGRGLDFEEVRQYVAGDDVRNIDWRVTARTGLTHTKIFNEEKERPTFTILDQCSYMFFGSQRFVKSVTAAHAAALGAFYTIKRGDRVGGLIFNEDSYDHIAPKRSKALVQHFLQLIVNKNKLLPERKTIKPDVSRLNEMLRRTHSIVTHDYVIEVISDFTYINDETRHLLKSLSYHNDVIVIHVYDALDEALPDGKLILGDGRRQINWQNNKRNWGRKYSDDFQDMQSHLINDMRHYRIPVVFFNTMQTVEDQIMDVLGKKLKQ